MRFQSVAALCKSDGKKLNSGVSYSTAPDIPLNALVVEDGKIFEFVRLSGTIWSIGSLAYLTGTAGTWVVCTGTGAGMPYGISLIDNSTSGVYTWIQKYGICSNIQITGTVGASAGATSILVGGESAAGNVSMFFSNIASGAVGGYWPVFGRSLTATTASACIGFIDCMVV